MLPCLRATFSLVLLLSVIQVAAAEVTRPNVVIVLVDDMGWSDIGCYGGEIPTPFLDSLSKNGVRFTQFYNTARCSPTRASLLTGLYPHQAGMGHLANTVHEGTKGTTGNLREDCVTIAEVLRDSGYYTAMAGKWHLGQAPNSTPVGRGFTRSLNATAGGIYFSQQKNGADLFLDGKRKKKTDPTFGDSWYSVDLWTDWGLKFADEAIDAKQPFFLYIAQCAPHFPLMAPRPLIDKYRGKYKQNWDKLREARHKRQVKAGLVKSEWPLSPRPEEVPNWDSLSEEDKDRFDHMMAIYAAMIESIDNSVGKLVGHLKKRGVLDNTLILFLSDNGGNAESGPMGRYQGKNPGGPASTVFLGQSWATLNNTPFRRYKHFTHEGGISTPLIAHWPAGIPVERNGTLEHQPGHLIDLMATIVDVTRATYPLEYKGNRIQPMEGVSLKPAFAGSPLNRTNPIYFEHEGNRAIRDGKWKLVMKHQGDWELYDIDADRTEQRDVSRDHPERVLRLADDWETWAKRSDVHQWPGPARDNAGAERVKRDR